MELNTLMVRDEGMMFPGNIEETMVSEDMISLPVAPMCNIQCKYCVRTSDCAHGTGEDTSSEVLTKEEAVSRVREMVGLNSDLRSVIIEGPGEPLANDRTFEVLRTVKKEFPHLTLGLSTNGLLLTDRLEDIVRTDVRSVTITINAVVPEEAMKIYEWVYYHGARYRGWAAADCLSFNQWRGLRNAIDAGLYVNVKTIYMPGVNEKEIPYIAWLVGRRGADLHTIVPLVPKGKFEHLYSPTPEMMDAMQERIRKIV